MSVRLATVVFVLLVHYSTTAGEVRLNVMGTSTCEGEVIGVAHRTTGCVALPNEHPPKSSTYDCATQKVSVFDNDRCAGEPDFRFSAFIHPDGRATSSRSCIGYRYILPTAAFLPHCAGKTMVVNGCSPSASLTRPAFPNTMCQAVYNTSDCLGPVVGYSCSENGKCYKHYELFSGTTSCNKSHYWENRNCSGLPGEIRLYDLHGDYNTTDHYNLTVGCDSKTNSEIICDGGREPDASPDPATQENGNSTEKEKADAEAKEKAAAEAKARAEAEADAKVQAEADDAKNQAVPDDSSLQGGTVVIAVVLVLLVVAVAGSTLLVRRCYLARRGQIHMPVVQRRSEVEDETELKNREAANAEVEPSVATPTTTSNVDLRDI